MQDSIIYIGLAQCLFAAFALATRIRVRPTSYILIACLLTFALKFITFALEKAHGDYLNLEFSVVLIPMTFGPFLYLYTVYYVENRRKFLSKDLYHFLPFALMTIVYFLFLKDVVEFRDVDYFNTDKFLWIRILYGLILFFTILFYTIVTFQKIRQYQKETDFNLSFSSKPLKLKWLMFVPITFTIFFTLYFTFGIINAVENETVVDVNMLSHFGLTFISFLVSYFGLRQPSFFYSELIETEENKNTETEDKNDESKFSDNELEALSQNLNRIMVEERVFLNPLLTLSDLAFKTNMKKADLTYLLNKVIGKNFFTYVNEFRIQEVIRKFKSKDYDHYTIIAIAYESGFNSKSTFNSLFKEYTNQTPSQFRSALKNTSE